MHLHNLTWHDFQDLPPASKIFILPLGSTEQHGHHLPLSVDSTLAEAVAHGVHDTLPDDIVLLPTLWCGMSTHHMAFPGTVSVSQDVYQTLLVDLCDSLIAGGARKILLLNGHGGNDIPARFALRNLKSRHSDKPELTVAFASYWNIAAKTLSEVRTSEIGGMGHACEMETSLMLLLKGNLVKMDLAHPDGPTQHPPYRIYDMQKGSPCFMVEDFHEISTSGTVGHPNLATAEKGVRFLEGIISEVSAFVKDFETW